MKPKEWWIEFRGDEASDEEMYKRYVSGEELKPVCLGYKIVRVVEADAYDKLVAALEYVVRHKDTPKQTAPVIIDECATVCEQALVGCK